MKNVYWIVIYTIILGSCSSNKHSVFEKNSNNISIDRTKGYKYINPLLDCGIQFKEITPFVSKIRNYVNTKIENGDAKIISVYFRHLNNGYWFGINENTKFNPASMMKVPIMMEFLKIAEQEPNVVYKQLEFKKKFGDCNYFGTDSLILGNKYPAIELLERMIKYSDNYAAGVIYDFNRLYTNDSVFFNEVMINNNINGRNPYDSVIIKDYAGFFRILYNASFLNKQMSEFALDLLTSTTFKYTIVRGINDSTINVAHKFGERFTDNDYQLHDCGIVYYPNEPYILCVMTRGSLDEPKKMDTIIVDISRMVYQEVDKQFKKK
ncbi:MAG: beta-lactamase class A-like protein, beta-lactamase [Candidatus Peregrinibacteria bacterium GW2011_GWF2_33_10]|nr:MAG: beta-lactamase class A-like protein, beta-lactamase [Candidatus Peregrinibacteria bacterium GW2011_GWF2_33_10]